LWLQFGGYFVYVCCQKRREVVHARRTEVIASRSELLSLHCPRHPLLRALFPACADPQVITRQDCSAYAAEPLRTAGLLEAAHQYSLQDVCGSARTPIPTALPTQERQFKNLVFGVGGLAAHGGGKVRLAMQTARAYSTLPRRPRRFINFVTPKGVLRLARCNASATREGP